MPLTPDLENSILQAISKSNVGAFRHLIEQVSATEMTSSFKSKMLRQISTASRQDPEDPDLVDQENKSVRAHEFPRGGVEDTALIEFQRIIDQQFPMTPPRLTRVSDADYSPLARPRQRVESHSTTIPGLDPEPGPDASPKPPWKFLGRGPGKGGTGIR